MSIKALNWAYAQPVRGPAKAVLCALAFRANGKTGLCNPGMARICADTGLGEATVKRALRNLMKLKMVRIISRRDGKYHLPNEYILACEQSKQGGSRADPGVGSERTQGGVGPERTQGGSRADPKHGMEHKNLSQKKDRTEVEGRRYTRGLRVVGGDFDPNPWADDGGAT